MVLCVMHAKYLVVLLFQITFVRSVSLHNCFYKTTDNRDDPRKDAAVSGCVWYGNLKSVKRREKNTNANKIYAKTLKRLWKRIRMTLLLNFSSFRHSPGQSCTQSGNPYFACEWQGRRSKPNWPTDRRNYLIANRRKKVSHHPTYVG